jgi:LysM repeat protein
MLALPSVGRRACSCLLVIGALVLAGSAHYTVRAGDTLSGIAAAHGVSASAVAAANGISGADLIHAGQSLDIPAGSGRAEASVDSGGGGHVVRPGETLSDIARRYGIGVADLAAANDVADVNVVIEGRRLRVPAPAAVVPAPRSASSRADVGTLLEQTARDYGWNPAMVKALAMQESGWNNRVVSSVGAVGIMQVLPSTGEFVSQRVVGRPLDLRDPADNVEAGVAFLDHLHGLTGGDTRRTLAGYYQGLRSVERNGMYEDTVRYIDNVLALRDRY